MYRDISRRRLNYQASWFPPGLSGPGEEPGNSHVNYMLTHKKTLLAGAAAVLTAILATVILAIFPFQTNAAPPALFPNCYLNGSAAAGSSTSTRGVYITAGRATTTMTCNLAAGTDTVPDYADLLAQMTASSTLSTLNINDEYSMDGIDWYQNNLEQRATTTATHFIGGIVNRHSWGFASTTPGLGVVASNASRDHKILRIETPTKWVRVIFTVPIGSTASYVYAELVGRTQVR
jgi:hypothetical protein